MINDILNEYEDRVIYFNCKKATSTEVATERLAEISVMFKVLSAIAFDNASTSEQTTRISSIWRYLKTEQKALKYIIAQDANKKFHEDLEKDK